MKLDNGSLMFNLNLKKPGNTPSWGTSLGQSERLEYRFTKDDYSDILVSMVYTKINNLDNLECILGRAGADQSNYNIVLASIYNKVFVNNEYIKDAKFVLVLSQELTGANKGRRTLKYNPKFKYNNYSNEDCFDSIRDYFNIDSNGAWFITDITTKNQDEIHFKAYFPDNNNPLIFEDGNSRKDFMEEFIEKNADGSENEELIGNNIIYYGVPGTGKSYEIDQILKDTEETNKFRVTFHPEYTYNDFVGQLLPITDDDGKIDYKFVEGPFTKALQQAYSNRNEMVYLVIEEMSRGNCAAIFGDLFQLLDRAEESNFSLGYKKGWSMYKVDNSAIASKIPEIIGDKIQIPANLTIFGTVNTSDQNVFVMDTAFKRRFDWKYIKIKAKNKENSTEYLNDCKIEVQDNNDAVFTTWINLYNAINYFISSKDRLNLGEDKQIGQFFIKNIKEKTNDKIRDKLLQYLWFDIYENSYNDNFSLFDSKIDSFSTLYDFYENNKKIFSDVFIEDLRKLEI